MNYLTNYYKNLAKELQEKLSNLQEQYNALLNEEKKEEKPLAEPSTKEGSEAKRVPLNIKTKKTDPKEEKEKVEKEDMVMKEENGTIAFSLKNAILKIMQESNDSDSKENKKEDIEHREKSPMDGQKFDRENTRKTSEYSFKASQKKPEEEKRGKDPNKMKKYKGYKKR